MMILVDLSAMFFRIWHATQSGPDAYTVTLEQIRELTRSPDDTPNTIVICCEGRSLLRAQYYGQYKANREAKPPELIEALAETIAELSTWPINVVAVDGYEADDVIYTLARHSTESVLILSSDKDLYACLSERVTLRTSAGKTIGPAECFAKFGVRPDQIPDFLALTGDVADNIPGCPHCGPGRAALLLQRFGTLDAIKSANALQTQKIRGIGKSTAFALLEWDPTLARRLTRLLEIPDLVNALKPQLPPSLNTPHETEYHPMDMSKIVTKRKAGPLKILAYGPEGVGKTRFAAFSVKPIFLCAENGLSAPDLSEVPAFPSPDNWQDCMAAIEWLHTEKHEYRTLVIDSLDWLYQVVKSDVCAVQKMTIADFEAFGRGDKFTYDYWVKFQAAIEHLQEERGMHVIAIAHSSTKVFQNPGGEDFMRYQLGLSEKAAERWKQWPDLLLFMSQEIFTKKGKDDRNHKGIIGDYQIFTTRTAAFDAKSRIRLPPSIPYETANPWRPFSAAVRQAAAATATPGPIKAEQASAESPAAEPAVTASTDETAAA